MRNINGVPINLVAYKAIHDYERDMSAYVIDVGALNLTTSNTLSFADRDYRVLLVEPNPSQIELLRKETKDYFNIELLPKAIYSYDGTIEFIDSTEKGHSRISNKNFDKQKAWTTKNVNKIQVECITFKTLFESYPQYIDADFIDIDVEGNDEIVLESLFKTECRPMFIMIENHGDKNRMNIQNKMFEKENYKHFLDIGDSALFKLKDNE